MDDFIVNGAIEDDIVLSELSDPSDKELDDIAGGEDNGIIKALPEKLRVYNQLNVDPYSCVIVANATAISNWLDVEIPYSVMIKSLNEAKQKGLFISGKGMSFKEGNIIGTRNISEYLGISITPHLFTLTEKSIKSALRQSPVTTGIYYGSGYFFDEQDNAWIDKFVEGGNGHSITLGKANYVLDFLIKFLENYHGRPYTRNGKKEVFMDVIGCDYGKYGSNFFKTGMYFTK